ncbi:MAG: Geranylgeranyl pyrophosphate synthase [Acidimicrobiaceae bacterium]|nr:Geranylgeranyl pyrophosphate synthase [Acidimicrobiaceae bacterium]
MNAPDLFALPVPDEELVRLENCLSENVVRGDDFLDEIATHLVDAGGKRLRPALTIASAALGGLPASEDTLLGGVCVELVHLASLYHDDVMDEATRRRNVVSVNARWGNLIAIVAGDFLLARSAEIAASLGTEVAGLLAATLGRLCQGQIAEVQAAYRVDRTEEAYLRAVADKTAALMSTACRIGGITAGLDRESIDALTEFGECLGVVFQIRDDVLDVVASEEELGKPPGQDLAEGIYTLPVQRALLDRRVAPRLREVLGHPLSREEVELARELVARSNGIAAAANVARRHAEQASEAVGRLGDGLVARALGELGLGLLDDLERSRSALAS